MRNYWLRIFIGAFAIFTIGMVGVTLVRHGIAKVNKVVESSDPLTIPLGLIPFALSGERLGNLDHVVIYRDSPREVTGVELEVNLGDSLLARGLQGCRLAANFESDPREPGINLRTSHRDREPFSCLPGDSVPPNLVPFGEAVFQPGEVRVPLYLEQELVTELRQALSEDSLSLAEAQAESLAELAELRSDSIVAEVRRSADSLARASRRLGDSLRAAALREATAAEDEAERVAESTEAR